jgi:hypothetical protein
MNGPLTKTRRWGPPGQEGFEGMLVKITRRPQYITASRCGRCHASLSSPAAAGSAPCPDCGAFALHSLVDRNAP